MFVFNAYELTPSNVFRVFSVFPINRIIDFFHDSINDGKNVSSFSCSVYVNLPILTGHLIQILSFHFPYFYAHDAVFEIGYKFFLIHFIIEIL